MTYSNESLSTLMLILLPLISFLLFLGIIYPRATVTPSWRVSFLKASLIMGLCVQISTEVLSIFHLFTPPLLGFLWLAVLIGTLSAFLKIKPWQKISLPKFQEWNFIDAALASCIGLIILVTGIIALIAPPNNWDSMTYHMSRVAHWVQNKSVEFYPTAILRQLWASPWAEYAIAQTYLLIHSDRMANLVQWASMSGSVIGVSVIAKQLGALRRDQILSALLCASIPMGILQATSTQNDYAAGFWAICIASFCLELLKNIRLSTVIWLSLALGLSLMTKTTGLLFTLPLLCVTLIRSFQLEKTKSFIFILIIVTVPLLFNLPQYTRNYHLGGNPFSFREESKLLPNKEHSLQAVISNGLRYLGLNLCTSSSQTNQQVSNTVTAIHNLLGWNVTDERYTWGEEYKIKQYIHEDNSCNTAHTVLFLFLTIIFITWTHRNHRPEVKVYLSSLWIGFLLFCVLLKWQPWGNRLLLPLAALATPFMGTVLYKKFPRLSILIGFAVTILSFPWLLINESRPLTGKDFNIFTKDHNAQYFSNNKGMQFSYDRAVEEILKSSCSDIGLLMSWESWEYPLWPLLNAPSAKNLRLEHIEVDNPSKKFPYPRGTFNPCIVLSDNGRGIATVTLNGTKFIKTNQLAYLSLYRKDADGSLTKNTRSSNFRQMLEYAFAADRLLQNAQAQGKLDQNAFMESFRLRQISINYAEMLDWQDLDQIYPELGTQIKDYYMKGSASLMDGLSTHNPEQINQGQAKLAEFNIWIATNLPKLQTAFE
ncbi:MAG: glycosyltransferase family 39 protein [Candidatus Omnitrophica bacterium]|nr:glycosyltransferase family 39 protein [Candidatus Omnitrophota bacterium]